ncbi:hypothetical protein [Sphingomonas sp. OK281]|uniref:hypothetical protein n=1 Tax=Sphingomonas sp. OK281 TaxID=1881067 RepID=UPI0008E9B6A1|nr:hypothetical protein [Sphingomonas sp. OK281]SFO25447.1 hypothetical protein SAMN05428984_2977 [Sphingomonas sp. OK281]
MIRPDAIVRYERLYWAAFVLDTVVTAMTWTQREAIVTAYPVLAKATWILPTFQAIGIAVTVLLWYFTARAPSVVAKWVVVVLAALSTLTAIQPLAALANGSATLGTTSILSLIATALYVAAAVHLFQPGSKIWFAKDADLDTYADRDIGPPIDSAPPAKTDKGNVA